MGYTAILKPSVLVTEVVVVPIIGVMVVEFGLLAIHAVKAKSLKVIFRPYTSFFCVVIIVAFTELRTGVLVCYLVVKFV